MLYTYSTNRMFSFLNFGYLRSKHNSASYYKSRLNRIATWEKLYQLIHSKDHNELSASRNIEFSRVAFGSSTKQVTKLLGKPRFVIENNMQIPGHVVYFYKFNFEGISTRCEVHFINNSFFLSTYSFHRTLDGNTTEIKKVLFSKYLNNTSVEFDNALKIRDSQNNSIIIESDVEFMVTYLSGDNRLFELVLEKIRQKEELILAKEEKRNQVLMKML